jgi:hypothetical protein
VRTGVSLAAASPRPTGTPGKGSVSQPWPERAEARDTTQLPLARALASQITNPAWPERAAALSNRVKGDR